MTASTNEQATANPPEDIRWWALLERRRCLMVIAEIERRYPDLPRSIVPKDQRERPATPSTQLSRNRR